MKNTITTRRVWSVSLILVVLLGGCAIRLVPNYDQTVVDGLTSVNTSMMEFFAFVSGGTNVATYEKREETYSKLIGGLDALKLQVEVRPVPNNPINDAINKMLAKRNRTLPEGDMPSAVAIGKISEAFVKMRAVDQKQGVTAVEVQAFRNEVIIYMDQALTYENFLKRE